MSAHTMRTRLERRLIRIAKGLGIAAGTLSLVAAALFLAFEHSALLRHHLDLENRVRYFAIRHWYRPDPQLVFVNRGPAVIQTMLVGDLFSPQLGVHAVARPYAATYTSAGFRVNSRRAPFEILAVGDSFLEIGEDDRDTLTERLSSVSGLAVANLGVAWYGPPQYVELLKRFGPRFRPGIVAMFFFEGNDFEDIRAYRQWERGGKYYFYRDLSQTSWPARFAMAASDTATALRGLPALPLARRNAPHPALAKVRLANEVVDMRFGYWSPGLSLSALRSTTEYRLFEGLLEEFRTFASTIGSVPMLVFVPMKVGVYGPLVTGDSGSEIISRMATQRKTEATCFTAVAELAARLDIPFVDLRTPFRAMARTGTLLYYPFDTHWNSRGREIAAREIASALTRVTAEWNVTRNRDISPKLGSTASPPPAVATPTGGPDG